MRLTTSDMHELAELQELLGKHGSLTVQTIPDSGDKVLILSWFSPEWYGEIAGPVVTATRLAPGEALPLDIVIANARYARDKVLAEHDLTL